MYQALKIVYIWMPLFIFILNEIKLNGRMFEDSDKNYIIKLLCNFFSYSVETWLFLCLSVEIQKGCQRLGE